MADDFEFPNKINNACHGGHIGAIDLCRPIEANTLGKVAEGSINRP
jgi:hypothetical protein